MSEYEELKTAVAIIKDHLEREWITDGCEKNAAFGCASCQAVRLKNDLDALLGWVEEDEFKP